MMMMMMMMVIVCRLFGEKQGGKSEILNSIQVCILNISPYIKDYW